MSERKWAYRVRHMIDAIIEIKTYTQGMDFEAFAKNRQVQRAVERCFEILGEAATKIPDDVQQKYPAIPWSKIKGMRHFVIHDYDRVLDLSVWNTVSHDLEPLQSQLHDISLPENE
jgi:uncharacterized protein with HEPN domain